MRSYRTFQPLLDALGAQDDARTADLRELILGDRADLVALVADFQRNGAPVPLPTPARLSLQGGAATLGVGKILAGDRGVWAEDFAWRTTNANLDCYLSFADQAGTTGGAIRNVSDPLGVQLLTRLEDGGVGALAAGEYVRLEGHSGQGLQPYRLWIPPGRAIYASSDQANDLGILTFVLHEPPARP